VAAPAGINHVCLFVSTLGPGEEADAMRTATTLALAAIGVLNLALPAAAQSGAVSIAPKSSSVAKRVAPQRLSPPGLPLVQSTADDKTSRDDLAPPRNAEPTQPAATPPPAPSGAPQTVRTQRITPDAIAPQRATPQTIYARPTLGAPAYAEPQTRPAVAPEFASPERLLDWVSNYRDRPQLWKVPAAVHAMREHGLFTDEEQRWFCIGFVAGVLGTNPNDGPKLVTQMFPMPAKEQEVIIRAIAYSGRPDWQTLLQKNAAKMPLRKPLIEDFLDGSRPELKDLALEVGGAPGIYAHWGYYVATGQHEPVMRIMQALQWSRGKEDPGFSFGKIFSGWSTDPSAVDKITTGGTAKWTLASYAERDRELISLYRAEYRNQSPEVAEHLKDVIEAAELFEAEKIRKEQYGAIEDAQQRQMTAEAGMSKGMTAGSIAIATGCVAATALGQAQIAVPCVIGGALYSGAAKLGR